jgi:phosphatidylglycerophosphate synthase
VGLNRAGIVCSAAYLLLGLAWVAGTNPEHPFWLAGWFVALAAIGSVIPGFANQASLARAYLVAPALTYALVPGRLGLLAVVLAIAGLSDVVDGTIARRFDRPSAFGGGLDPVVDGLLLGAVAIGLALGGTFPLWLAGVIVARYLLPAIVGLVLISMHRRLELRHTVTGQISTALIIILVGGICLFRFMSQDAENVVIGAEIVIPITTAATFVHLGWVAWRSITPSPA